MEFDGVELGTCCKCRERTLVAHYKLEAREGEAHPVVAPLCSPCVTGLTIVRATKLVPHTPERLTHVYV